MTTQLTTYISNVKITIYIDYTIDYIHSQMNKKLTIYIVE